MAPDLERILGEAPHGFQIGLARGDGSFFLNAAGCGTTLSARVEILDRWPGRHAVAVPRATDALLEAADLFRSLHPHTVMPRAHPAEAAEGLCNSLGRLWEPDFVILARRAPEPVMEAGCVCFPSWWAPEEKLGLAVSAIHEPVPGLNTQLADRIRTFLTRMKPDADWERWNWGLSATPVLNTHPALALPRLTTACLPQQAWLRLEHQCLRVLPRNGALLFGIRVTCEPLLESLNTTALRLKFAGLLDSMSEELAAYKGLAACRAPLAAALRR